jgi:hypothetical protein
MRHSKLVSILCVAVFAATLGVANSAFAVPPLPSVLPGEATWKGKAIGITLLSTKGGHLILCANATTTGTLALTTKTLGEFHTTYGGCLEPGTSIACTGTNDTSGSATILSLGTWHSVVDVNSPELHSAILFLPAEINFKCSIVPMTVEPGGMLLCLVRNPLTSAASHEFLCETKKSGGKDTGEPVETKYFNGKEETTIKPLMVSVNGGAAEELSIEDTATIEFKEAQKIDD